MLPRQVGRGHFGESDEAVRGVPSVARAGGPVTILPTPKVTRQAPVEEALQTDVINRLLPRELPLQWVAARTRTGLATDQEANQLRLCQRYCIISGATSYSLGGRDLWSGCSVRRGIAPPGGLVVRHVFAQPSAYKAGCVLWWTVRPSRLSAVSRLREHAGDGRCLNGRAVQLGVVHPHVGQFECLEHHPLGEAGLGEGKTLVESTALGGLPGLVAPHVDVEDRCHVLRMVDGMEWAVGVVGLPNDHDAAGRQHDEVSGVEVAVVGRCAGAREAKILYIAISPGPAPGLVYTPSHGADGTRSWQTRG